MIIEEILTPVDFCKRHLSNRTNLLEKKFSFFHDKQITN